MSSPQKQTHNMGHFTNRHVSGWLFAIAALLLVARLLHARFHFDIHSIEALIQQYGYFGIPIVIFLGNLGVPVPEETAVLLGGLAARRGDLSYEIVVPLCIATAILGDSLGFLIGRIGGRPLIVRYGARVGITKERFDKYEAFFENYGARTVFVARFIAGLRFMAGPLAGAAGLPFHRFLAANALGATLWVFAMTQIGYHLGPRILHVMAHAQLAILLILISAFGIFLKTREAHRMEPVNRSPKK